MDDGDEDEEENADAGKDKNMDGEEEHPRVVTDMGFPITIGQCPLEFPCQLLVPEIC